VSPVLEQLAFRSRPAAGAGRARLVPGETVEDLAWVRADTRVDRHVVRTAEDVDRVELQHAHGLEYPPQVPDVDAASRARNVKALGRERESTRITKIESDCGQWGHRSPILVQCVARRIT
jgi:hypothetical protein